MTRPPPLAHPHAGAVHADLVEDGHHLGAHGHGAHQAGVVCGRGCRRYRQQGRFKPTRQGQVLHTLYIDCTSDMVETGIPECNPQNLPITSALPLARLMP